jgi:hypothetical protein
MFLLPTHGSRRFDKLRAGCGLHSFAASRLRKRNIGYQSSKLYFSPPKT